ncbi:MAG: hypothetical protein AB3N17_11670, partial [Tateyamaria sp.]
MSLTRSLTAAFATTCLTVISGANPAIAQNPTALWDNQDAAILLHQRSDFEPYGTAETPLYQNSTYYSFKG